MEDLMGTTRVAREHGSWPQEYAYRCEWAVSSSKKYLNTNTPVDYDIVLKRRIFWKYQTFPVLG
jgi:hypothetical protein